MNTDKKLTPQMQKCLNALLLELPEEIVKSVTEYVLEYGQQEFKRGKKEANEWVAINEDDEYSFPAPFDVVALLLEDGEAYIGYRMEYSDFRGDDEYEVLVPGEKAKVISCDDVVKWKEINVPAPPQQGKEEKLL